jgi:two-component system, sensor histidine kinase PdtaS
MRDRIIILVLFGLLHSACMAQFYPAPPPIDSRLEPELLLQLKNAETARDSIRIQLQLCNLNFNKPFKKKADLERALHYARKASALSTSLHDSTGYTDAQLFVADVLAEQGDIQAAENILPLLNDSAKINLLLALSFEVENGINSTDPAVQDKAIRLAEQARQLSLSGHYREKEILALLDIAAVHADQNKQSAEQELLTVIAAYRAIGYRNLHYVFNRLAVLEYYIGKKDNAFNYSLQTLISMRSTGDSLAAGDFYYVQATLYTAIDEPQKGVDYSRLAIASYALHSGRWVIAQAVNELIHSLRKMRRFDEALESALRLNKQFPPGDPIAETAFNTSIGELYMDMKKYGSAESYLLLASELQGKYGSDAHIAERDLGRLYVESRQYEKARPYLNKALSEDVSFPNRSYTHYLLYLVDSATGHYLAAIAHLHKNHNLADSTLAEAKQREIQRLLVQFDTKEKENKLRIEDQDIALLNQKAVSQKAQLSRSNLLRNITIGSALLFMIIAFFIYRSYRVKQRINRLILQKNETLEQLVTEKEWLLKEVHHRVKNNLHTVNCLLDSQACYLENDALKAIQKSQQRIYAMSMIHQKIYQSDDIRTINMANYLPEFIGYLRDSFGAPANIQFELDVEALDLGVTHAVPVALIVNEAVNNSIKHAFADDMGGQILIALRRIGQQVQLSVADDGIGISPEFMDGDADSLGMQLMKGLSREMKGTISIEAGRGTRVIILFDSESIDEFQPLSIRSKEKAMAV